MRELHLTQSQPVSSLTEIDVERPEIPSDYYLENRIRDWDMSRVTKGLLRRFNVDEIVCRRRENYKMLDESLLGIVEIKLLQLSATT